MTRLYFHGNCQTRAMARMLRELDAGLEIRGREVHTMPLPGALSDYRDDIAWADVIVTQPIAETYRDEPCLSLRWLREHKRPDARIAVFPSLFFRAYTPQVHYLPPLRAVAMPYHDAYLLRGYTLGRTPEAVAAELDDPGFIPAALVEREREAALAELRQREDRDCDIRASDLLRTSGGAGLLFHTPNHPGRDLLWRVLDRVLDGVGVGARPRRAGIDYLGDLTIPPPASVAPPAGAYPSRYRLPGRDQPLSRAAYAAELWAHYAAIGGTALLADRLAAAPGPAGFLRRHDAAVASGRPKPKRNLGPPTKLVQPPLLADQAAWRDASEGRWMAVPPRPRLAPAPIVDRNEDLIFFLGKTHHRHRVGLWSYPSGTVGRGRGLSVSFLERAEGAVLGARGFHYATQWLDQVPAPPAELIERHGRDIHVDIDALTRPVARLGEHILCFDGNWRSYYHWLIDCVSRLFVLRGLSDGRILMPAAPDAVAPFHLDSLRGLGIAEDRLHWPEPGRALEKYQHLIWMNWEPTPWGGLGMLAALGAAYRAHAGAGAGAGPGRRRLYVARGGGRRRVLRAAEIEALMVRLGFTIVRPEQLGFAEQVRLFAEASWVVGAHGAGLTNILFAPPGCTVVEFMPDILCRPHYWGMATSLGHRHAVMVVPGKSYFDDMDVDPGRLEAFVTALAAHADAG